MKTKLEMFLLADELNDTLQLAGQIGDLTPQEKSGIETLIQQWNEQQAIANLLMFPKILPEEIREDTLLKGLHQPTDSYYVLAAIVGLQRNNSELSETKRKVVIHSLLDSIQRSPSDIANQASIALIDFSRSKDIGLLLELLNHPSDLIKNNVFIALQSHQSLSIKPVIDQAFVEGTLSAPAKLYADERFKAMNTLFDKGKLDQQTWYLSDFSAPLLTFIPNLNLYATTN